MMTVSIYHDLKQYKISALPKSQIYWVAKEEFQKYYEYLN